MNREEFAEICEKSTAELKAQRTEGDPESLLAAVNSRIKIVRVVRLKKRLRTVLAAAVMTVLGAICLALGILYTSDGYLVLTVILASALFLFGGFGCVTSIDPFTHKAVCLRENGKVREFIYARNGKFTFNTIEGETVFFGGKTEKHKHDHTRYEPLFPYADFLDKDFADFMKARGGKYESDAKYVIDGDTVTAYEDSGKRLKFVLFFENGLPLKMDYRHTESYIYSRLNESGQKVLLPRELKGKINVPPYINVEYIEGDDIKKLWKTL